MCVLQISFTKVFNSAMNQFSILVSHCRNRRKDSKEPPKSNSAPPKEMPNSWKAMIESGMHIGDAEFKRIRDLEKKNNNVKREKTSSAKDSVPVVSSETLDTDKGRMGSLIEFV